MRLYGEDLSRREVARRAGSLSQFAGVRLMTLADGAERGVRMLEFRSGTGLRFTVMVDRCMDIADCDFRGMSFGWNSPAGFKHPGLMEYEGEGGLGWLRGFSGLLATCGLDHILFMDSEPGDRYGYAARETVEHSIHGRAAYLPARLTGYGERWEGDRCFLWAEGVISQSAVFAEDLHLIRRIEIEAGTNEIRLSDRVENRGFAPTPHMLLYHINVGHPVIAEGARYLAPIEDVVWAGHAGDRYRAQGVGYRTLAGPRENFAEQVWEYEMAADPSGEVPVAVVNDALGLGFEVVSRKDQMPCHYQWQNFQEGLYCMGVEPSTNHVLGHGYARDNSEMIVLRHGEGRSYDVTMRVLDGAAEIAAAERRIVGIARQPDADYPEPSGDFRPIAGRT